MDFSKKIRELRKHFGLTQAQLAEKLNIKQSPISQIESGKIQPSLDLIIKFIRIFNISFEYFTSDDVNLNVNLNDNINVKVNSKNIQLEETPGECSHCLEKERIIDSLKEQVKILTQQVTDLRNDKLDCREMLKEALHKNAEYEASRKRNSA
jgi:transcriptional regulator with XRE-family HTH domain